MYRWSSEACFFFILLTKYQFWRISWTIGGLSQSTVGHSLQQWIQPNGCKCSLPTAGLLTCLQIRKCEQSRVMNDYCMAILRLINSCTCQYVLKTVDTAGELVPYGSVKSVVVILTSFWLTVPTVDSEMLVAVNIIKTWLYPALQVN